MLQADKPCAQHTAFGLTGSVHYSLQSYLSGSVLCVKPRTILGGCTTLCKQLPAAQHRGRLRCVCLQAGGSHRAQARATTHAQDTLRRNQTYQSPNRHRALRLNSPSTPVVASSRSEVSLSLSHQPLPMSPSRRRYPRHATRTQRGVTQRGAQLTRSAQIKSCSARAGSLAY